jgi:hypothetical protein
VNHFSSARTIRRAPPPGKPVPRSPTDVTGWIGENAVVILSTHIVEDVAELCSRMAIINRGRILLEAEPLRAVDELRGRIWRRIVPRAELAAVERDHPVISTRLLAGRTVVRVYGEVRPGAEFEAVEPELEDVYGRQRGGGGLMDGGYATVCYGQCLPGEDRPDRH